MEDPVGFGSIFRDDQGLKTHRENLSFSCLKGGKS